jgi:hypothetical protein
MNSRALMSQADFAVHRGVSRPAVSNYKAQGLLVFAEGEGGKLFVDVARTDARLNAKLDPARGRPKKQDAQPQLEITAPAESSRSDRLGDVRTDLLQQQTIGARLKNAQAARQLVALQEYERRSQEVGRLARERVHAVIRSLAERLAVERDPRQITALLSGDIDKAFEDLADQVASGALTEVDELAAFEDAEMVADASPADD